MMKRFRLQKDKVIIQPYRGFSSPIRLYLRGRVLEDENIMIQQDKSLFKSIRDNFKRWESDEVPEVPVIMEMDQRTYETRTDREGYFLFDLDTGIARSEVQQWKDVVLQSSFNYRRAQHDLSAIAQLYLPSKNANFGIISDIDDTILQTDVLFRLKLLRNSLVYNSYERKELLGMSAWINALSVGPDGLCQNPVFYVSKSPRNIFDYLANFLDINGFPRGPILLRDFGRKGIIDAPGYLGHKEDEIERILNAYPDLPFIFFGDIAGKDPQIYHYIQEKYPKQVLSIYIRDIHHSAKQEFFQAWFKEKVAKDMVLIKDSYAGAQHAFEKGWINITQMAGIEAMM